MPQYFLKLPPEFYQGDSLHCWAAGSASWLASTRMGNATTEQLLARFKLYTNADESLPEGVDTDRPGGKKGGMMEVFKQLNVHLVKLDRMDFTHAWIEDKLRRKGHLLIMGGLGNMGHTQVIYGVGYPPGHFSVFDPLSSDKPPRKMSGYKNLPIANVAEEMGPPIYIGWAKWAGPS